MIQFNREAKGCSLTGLGFLLAAVSFANGSGPAFGWTSCVYSCGWGYRVVGGIVLMALGLALAFEKPKAL